MTTPFWVWGASMLAFTAALVAVAELARRRLRTYIVVQVLLLAATLFMAGATSSVNPHAR